MPKPSPTDARRARLHRIADALRLPVEALFDAPPGDEAADLRTLLRLWSAVDDIQARRRILSLARQEARRAGTVEET